MEVNNLTINIIASSSKGNVITVSDGVSVIMLDAGIPFSKIQRDVDLNSVEAVLITHSHMDHAKATHDLVRRGLNVCLPQETFDKLGVDKNMNGLIARSLEQFETMNWIILPFDIEHDVPCLGYLVQSKATGKKLVYAVDAPRINYDFTGVTHYIIEANYAHDILEESNYEEFVKNRIRRSHMSIENLVAFLKSSDLSQTEEIWLCHMSDANSHEKKFIEQVQQATGVPVFTGFPQTPGYPGVSQRRASGV